MINAISDYKRYLDRMDKSIEDKLFFVDMVEFDVIVDFGCANGSLLSIIKEMFPSVKLIGYDNDSTMLDSAKTILGNDALLTNDWNVVIKELSKYKSPLLNLSSVIHEVYSYLDNDNINYFWDTQVFNDIFKYITIREMLPSSNIDTIESDTFREEVDTVRSIYDPYYMESFESKWGSLYDNYRTFMHFLLKYRYIDNWDREVNENYIPVSIESIERKIPNRHEIFYKEHFILPFIQNEVMQDFGIEIKHNTHSKYIIKQ